MRSLMGNCISCIKQKKQPKRSVTLAILGLDSAGKTTTTNALKGDVLDTAPTIGFNKEEIEVDKFAITLYDLGGGCKIRDIWKNYLSEIFGVIYVVDSSAPERMIEVKENLESLLSHEKVQQKPLLILANKVDLPDHMDEVDIVHKLNINELVNRNKCPCQVMMCSAIKGTGHNMDKNIQDGMTWLCKILNQQYDTLKVRVDGDAEQYKKVMEREAEERKERVRIAREERAKREGEERKKLGIEKEEEDEDKDKEDFVDGDPFKRLNSEQIRKMEEKFQRTKAMEKAKQQKLKEIDTSENSSFQIEHLNNNSDSKQNKNRSSNSKLEKQMKLNEDESLEHSKFNRDSSVAHTSIKDDDNDNLRVPRSACSLLSLGWMSGGLSNGYHNHQVNDDDKLTPVLRSARNVLSPLQGFSSIKSADDMPASSVRDKKTSNKLKNKVGINDLANKYVDSYSSVLKIQVVPKGKGDDNDSDNIIQLSMHQDKFRNGQDQCMLDHVESPVTGIEQNGTNNQVNPLEDEDGVDTLRLSQHFGDGEAAGLPENYKSPTYENPTSHSPQGFIKEDAKRSETPVKKLKKKMKQLRNNKLHPSDEEFELSDNQTSPNRKPLPWVTSTSFPTMLDTEDTSKHTNWDLPDSLDEMNIQNFRHTRQHLNSEDGVL